MKKNLFILLFSILIFTACSSYDNNLSINKTKINLVDIADTQEKSYMGLSFRESICANCGMLFSFEEKKEHTFVMRDMMFPLDIIWIDDEIVVKISKNLEPEGHDTKNIYKSDQSVNNVLEVNGGFTDKENIKVGDMVKYNLQKNK
jgi:uncharacterized membrane protein (UPF0127 family)